jgi:hypothetical protein
MSELVEKSSLRNKFKIVEINGSTFLPYVPCNKSASVIQENGEDIERCKAIFYRGKNVVAVPFFEISYNPEMDAENIRGMSKEEYVNAFTKGSTILKSEESIWKKMKKYIRRRKGYLFIRTNPVVLEAHDPKNKKIGYSIFEQIGVAVAQ